MITFRRATQADVSLLSETRRRAWDATYRGIYEDEQIDAFDYALHHKKDALRIAQQTVYLMMDGAQCAGYFYYGAFPNGVYKDFELCLNSLYILPPYQGMGLGRRVFAHMREVCRAHGLTKFFCGCNIHNRNAQAFYRKMGGIVGKVDGGHARKAEDQMYFEFYVGETK